MGNQASTEGAVPEAHQQQQQHHSPTVQGRQIYDKNVGEDHGDGQGRSSTTTSISSSWGSLVAGLVRQAAFAIKSLGITGKVMHRIMTKKAFMHIGQRSMLHDSTTPVIHDHDQNASKYVQERHYKHARITGFVKGCVLGVTVFGVYEYLVLRQTAKNQSPQQQQPSSEEERHDSKLVYVVDRRDDDDDDKSSKSNHNHNDNHHKATTIPVKVSFHPINLHIDEQLSLVEHMAAGGLAGACQSVVLDSWEIASYWFHRRQYKKMHGGHAPGEIISLINAPLVLRRIYHHSLGYMTLFGTYECLRRQGQDKVRQVLRSGEPWVAQGLEQLHEHSIIGVRRHTSAARGGETELSSFCYDLTALPLLISFGAGGVAGQAHFVVSHYLKQIRKATSRSSEFLIKKKHHFRHPGIAPTLAAFFPTALGFMAFQYGGELTERLLDHDELF